MEIIIVLGIGVAINLVCVISFMVEYREAPSFAELTLIPYSVVFIVAVFLICSIMEDMEYKKNLARKNIQ